MSIVSEVYDACGSASKDNVFKVRLTVVGLGGAGSNAVSNF